jgi:hypothetical protein
LSSNRGVDTENISVAWFPMEANRCVIYIECINIHSTK